MASQQIPNKSGKNYADLGSGSNPDNWHSPGTTQTKSSYPQIQAATGGGSGTSYIVPGADQVIVETESSYPEVQAERERLIEKAVAEGTATESQIKEITPNQQVKIYIDKESINQYNQANAEAGIKNAEDYFNAIRTQTPPPPSTPSPNERPFIQAPYTAPVQKSISESTQPADTTKPIYDPGFEYVDTTQPIRGTAQPKWYSSFEGQSQRIEEAGNQAQAWLNKYKELGGHTTILKIGLGLATGGLKAIPETPIMIKELAKDPIAIPYNLVEGTFNLAIDTANKIAKGDIQGASENIGEAYVLGKTTHIITKPVFSYIKSEGIDLTRDIYRDIKQNIEGRGPPPPPGAGYGPPTSTLTTGREGVFVPPEYEGMGQNAQLGIRKAPELQTQLEPKKIDTLKSSLYSPEEYKPMTLQELAQQNPTLAKKLMIESGQTFFNDFPTRDLTPAERLAAALEQTKETPTPAKTELQKLLPGEIPPDFSGEVIFLENNKEVARFSLGKKGQQSMGTLIGETTYQDGLTKFRYYYGERTRITPAEPEIQIKTLPREGSPILGYQIIQDTNLRQDTPPITALRLEAQNQLAQIPALKSKYKIEMDTGQIPITIQPQQQEQSQTQEQTQQTETIITPIQTLTTPQEQVPRPPWQNERPIREPPRPPKIFTKPSTPNAPEKPVFVIQIRKGGIFKNFGTARNERIARSKAEKIVESTSAASYRITEGGQPIISESRDPDFTPSRKEKGVSIQKRSRRISSPGEKQEITYKGILTRRTKKRGGIF